jgi:hypothetical protein
MQSALGADSSPKDFQRPLHDAAGSTSVICAGNAICKRVPLCWFAKVKACRTAVSIAA